MRLQSTSFAFAAAAAFAASGCSSLKIVPPASPLPKESGAPLPLSVGVAYNAKFGDGQDLNGTRVDAVKSLTEALRASGLFREVRAPLASAPDAPMNADLLIAGDYDLTYRVDPGMMGKAFLGILIVPNFFLTCTDAYAGEATIDVKDASGRTIKQYDEKAAVEATYQMFSEGSADRQSPPLLLQNLISKIVADLIQDRALFQRAAAASPRPASQPSTGRETSGDQKTWWK